MLTHTFIHTYIQYIHSQFLFRWNQIFAEALRWLLYRDGVHVTALVPGTFFRMRAYMRLYTFIYLLYSPLCEGHHFSLLPLLSTGFIYSPMTDANKDHMPLMMAMEPCIETMVRKEAIYRFRLLSQAMWFDVIWLICDLNMMLRICVWTSWRFYIATYRLNYADFSISPHIYLYRRFSSDINVFHLLDARWRVCPGIFQWSARIGTSR